MGGARHKSDARAQRLACRRSIEGCFRAPLMALSGWDAVQGLFFGDFLLAPQKKVTPLPGGTPGNAPVSHPLRSASITTGIAGAHSAALQFMW